MWGNTREEPLRTAKQLAVFAVCSHTRNTSTWKMVMEKRDAFWQGDEDYGETPTNQADTTKLLVDFSGTTSGVKARVRRQTRGYGPNANAATDPILCGEG